MLDEKSILRSRCPQILQFDLLEAEKLYMTCRISSLDRSA